MYLTFISHAAWLYQPSLRKVIENTKETNIRRCSNLLFERECKCSVDISFISQIEIQGIGTYEGTFTATISEEAYRFCLQKVCVLCQPVPLSKVKYLYSEMYRHFSRISLFENRDVTRKLQDALNYSFLVHEKIFIRHKIWYLLFNNDKLELSIDS